MIDDNLISGYIQRSASVQWVAWDMKLNGDPHAKEFHAILFDGNDTLRDLSVPAVRLQVIEQAKKCLALRELVLDEVEGVVDKILAQIDQDNSGESSAANPASESETRSA